MFATLICCFISSVFGTGNEAADADSIVSSLCYAYFKQSILSESESGRIYCPVVQVNRTEVL